MSKEFLKYSNNGKRFKYVNDIVLIYCRLKDKKWDKCINVNLFDLLYYFL